MDTLPQTSSEAIPAKRAVKRATSTGDQPLQRPFHIVDHAQVRKTDVEIGDLKPEIVVAVVAMIDMMRPTRR